MNDRRFIELLNLYVDDQLDPADAAELEAEVLSNPVRRRTYNQYCRLQRGCVLLGDSARSLAPSSHAFARSLRDAERKIAAPRRVVTWRFANTAMVSATAMAACVAVVIVLNRPAPVADSGDPLFAEAEQPSLDKSAELTKVAVVPPSVTEPAMVFDIQPVLASAGLSAARTVREPDIAANEREVEWMQRVELLPTHRVVVDEQTFEARPTLQQDNRVFRSRHSLGGNAEFTAFQFQR